MTEPDWKKLYLLKSEQVADMLESMGVQDVSEVEMPREETKRAVERIRRDARNAALDEAAQDVLREHCGDGLCEHPPCAALQLAADRIRAMKETP